MAQPEVAVDYEKVQVLAKERSGLEKTVNLYHHFRAALEQQEDAQAILNDGDDAELMDLAQEELTDLNQRVESLGKDLRYAVLPRDPNDGRNVIVEVRKGAGG